MARIAAAKSFWASGGAAMVYRLALIGTRLESQEPLSDAIGIGLLFSARGLGTGIGPVVGRALFTREARWPLMMGSCIVISGFIYATTAVLPWTRTVGVELSIETLSSY